MLNISEKVSVGGKAARREEGRAERLSNYLVACDFFEFDARATELVESTRDQMSP